MLRQFLQHRCHSFTRSFSSIPASVSNTPTVEETTYSLKEIAHRKRKTEWKRRQGVSHVQPNFPASPHYFFAFLHRVKRFSTT